jgi:hypothetical protein
MMPAHQTEVSVGKGGAAVAVGTAQTKAATVRAMGQVANAAVLMSTDRSKLED